MIWKLWSKKIIQVIKLFICVFNHLKVRFREFKFKSRFYTWMNLTYVNCNQFFLKRKLFVSNNNSFHIRSEFPNLCWKVSNLKWNWNVLKGYEWIVFESYDMNLFIFNRFKMVVYLNHLKWNCFESYKLNLDLKI